MLSMGFVKNWSGLMSARFFLGLAEAGLYPGVNYFLSCWYKRNEFGVRAVSNPSLSPIILLTPPRPFSFRLPQSRDLSVVSWRLPFRTCTA